MFIKIAHSQSDQIFLFSIQTASYQQLKHFAATKFDIPPQLIYFYYVHNCEEKTLISDEDLTHFKASNVNKLYIQRQSEIIEIPSDDEVEDEQFQIYENAEEEEQKQVEEKQPVQVEAESKCQCQEKKTKRYLARLSELYEKKWKTQLNNKKQGIEKNLQEFKDFYQKELPNVPAIAKVWVWNYRQIKRIIDNRNESEL